MTRQPDATQDAEAFYDEMWQSYGHLDAVSPANFHRRRLVVELAQRFASNARSVLDVGCGQGELLKALARAFGDVDLTGADVSKESLAISRRKNPAFSFVQIDLAAADFAERHSSQLESFDLVVCCEVLEHLDDPARGLAEVARVARHSVLLSTPREPLWRILNLLRGKYLGDLGNTPGHIQHFSRSALRQLAAERLVIVEERAPLPWTILLGQPAKTARPL